MTPTQPFIALGHHRQRYYYRTAAAGVMWFNSGQLCRVGGAMDLIPDVEHWRTLYPMDGTRGGTVDWLKAGGALIKLAQDAGPYEPGAGEGPVSGSRLPYSPSERLAAYRLRQEARKVSTMVARAQRQAQRETPAG